ncbi:MAG: DNA topoisomerase (ATP-hydrolyzing) subunit A [Alphaproteobacteria bacterium]
MGAPDSSPQPSISIENEMERSYLDYAMSVIVSRALPDVRDGLKPVHRRILYSMKESGYEAGKPYRKSARIVGTVMGKYHPHGDSAIYDSMVRMAQDFSLRLPLVDGQGNFGSMDGDAAAAMRYTEARLARSAEALLEDIDKDTVDFIPNYDDSEHEPAVLPARFPNLLVNGAGGIAVGMATNIPPHNLGEVIDATIAIIEQPDISNQELLTLMPGPDFPTGGVILGRGGVISAFETGRGSVVMRAKVLIEDAGKDRHALIVNEIPYQVNKSKLIERIADLVREKTVEGISDLRDESDRDGVRIVIELKKGIEPEVMKAQLFRYSALQTSFGVNMLALDGGRPRQMGVKDALIAFNAFREQVIKRRTAYLLSKARDRAHILAGLLVAINNIDPVIALIRGAKDPVEARGLLMEKAWDAGAVAPFIALIDDPGHQVMDGKYQLSERQARAILELRLQRLTGLEQDKLQDETTALAEDIAEYLKILSSRPYRLELLKSELREVKEKFATPRRTVIEESDADHDIEDLIQREAMVVTVTSGGYIKRVPLSTYRAQRRGGKGRSGMTTKEDDVVSKVFVADTHTPLLFFSSAGMVYQMKVYRLPMGQPQSKGKALVNLFPLNKDEQISTIMPLPEDETSWADLFAVFATRSGYIRRNRLSDFTNIRANGKIAMKLDDDDRLIGVHSCTEQDDIMLASVKGMCIRFSVESLRIFAGRNSIGVRAMKLDQGDLVNSITILSHGSESGDDRSLFIAATNAKRRMEMQLKGEEAGDDDSSSHDPDAQLRDEERIALLSQAPYDQMLENEQFVFTIADTGMGQLCSAYGFRVTNRGGKGIRNMDLRGGNIVATFRVDPANDEIVLVTDGGQIIRCPLSGITPRRRGGVGVKVFNVADAQRVVSVERISIQDEPDADEDQADGDDAPPTEA